MKSNSAFKIGTKTKYLLGFEWWIITVTLHAKHMKVSLANCNQLYKSTCSINHDSDVCIELSPSLSAYM